MFKYRDDRLPNYGAGKHLAKVDAERLLLKLTEQRVLDEETYR